MKDPYKHLDALAAAPPAQLTTNTYWRNFESQTLTSSLASLVISMKA